MISFLQAKWSAFETESCSSLSLFLSFLSLMLFLIHLRRRFVPIRRYPSVKFLRPISHSHFHSTFIFLTHSPSPICPTCAMHVYIHICIFRSLYDIYIYIYFIYTYILYIYMYIYMSIYVI